MPWLPQKSSRPIPSDPARLDPVARRRSAGIIPNTNWQPKPRKPVIVMEEGVSRSLNRKPAATCLTLMQRRAAARSLHRIFNAAGFRFYRSSVAPPVAGSAPFATHATLAYQPADTYADGTWYLSVSYFDGVLDSGFQPLGKNGETYLTLEISGGAAMPARPSLPYTAALKVLAGGVIQIVSAYPRVSDGVNGATQWSIAYTTDGSTPPADSPSATPAMQTGPLALLAYNLPAQADGTIVKVQLQTLRGSVYSLPGDVLIATASAVGPSNPLDLRSWPGQLPQG